MTDHLEARYDGDDQQRAEDAAQCQRADQPNEDNARVKPELVTQELRAQPQVIDLLDERIDDYEQHDQPDGREGQPPHPVQPDRNGGTDNK